MSALESRLAAELRIEAILSGLNEQETALLAYHLNRAGWTLDKMRKSLLTVNWWL